MELLCVSCLYRSSAPILPGSDQWVGPLLQILLVSSPQSSPYEKFQCPSTLLCLQCIELNEDLCDCVAVRMHIWTRFDPQCVFCHLIPYNSRASHSSWICSYIRSSEVNSFSLSKLLYINKFLKHIFIFEYFTFSQIRNVCTNVWRRKLLYWCPVF